MGGAPHLCRSDAGVRLIDVLAVLMAHRRDALVRVAANFLASLLRDALDLCADAVEPEGRFSCRPAVATREEATRRFVSIAVEPVVRLLNQGVEVVEDRGSAQKAACIIAALRDNVLVRQICRKLTVDLGCEPTRRGPSDPTQQGTVPYGHHCCSRSDC